MPEEQAVATVRACIDHGITFLDTAEGYGVSEARVGKAIEGRRDEVFLATKVSGGDNTPEHIREAIDNSLKTLGTDYVDLYQIHAPSSETPIEDTMAEMLRQRDAGKFHYIGVSNFDEDMMSEAQKCGAVHSSQPRYSMLFRESEESILPFCLENGIGTMAYSVMAKGMLGGRYKPGHEFAKDDERSGWSHFQDQKVYDVIQALSDWAADHGRTLPQLAIAWVVATRLSQRRSSAAGSPSRCRTTPGRATGYSAKTTLRKSRQSRRLAAGRRKAALLASMKDRIAEILRGSFDLHVQAGPDPGQERRVDALDAGRHAHEGEMAGFVLKSHHYPTAPLAHALNRVYPGLNVVGAVTLNAQVGGLNPDAVEASAAMGAGVVWMPTYDADFFMRRQGLGSGVRVLDETGRLKPAVHDVIEVVRHHDMVLASGRLSPDETIALFSAATAAGSSACSPPTPR